MSGGNALLDASAVANARGLVRFPCNNAAEPLRNSYHLMRAGMSLLEADDIWSTNPLFLTNREAALSDLGERQVRDTSRYLTSAGASAPTVVRYSLAAASIDSANIVGDMLRVGRDRLVPEFNYMDPRAIGGWDYAAMNATEGAVWALDADEAGAYGKGGRPPPNEDGTPAETLSDQVVRLTNLMSVLETLYSGDTVLLVFPDGTGPALLSCLVGGIPLNRVHELQFAPGEIRCNVDYDSVNSLASRPPSPAYHEILRLGRLELEQLRRDPDLLRNVKDLRYEEEREREGREMEARREEEARARESRERRKREEMLERKELEARRREDAKAREMEKRKERGEKFQSRNDTQQSSLDSGSIGIAGTVLAGAAVLGSSMAGGGAGDGEVVNRGANASPTDDDTGNEVSPNLTTVVNEGTNATNITIGNETLFNATSPQDGGANNATEIDIGLPAPETDPKTEELLLEILPGEQRVDSIEIMSNNGRIEQPDVEGYDDAWLGAISEIMNDSNVGDD